LREAEQMSCAAAHEISRPEYREYQILPLEIALQALPHGGEAVEVLRLTLRERA
jgi:hypothetical protein